MGVGTGHLTRLYVTINMIKPNVKGGKKVGSGIAVIYTRSGNQTRY